VKALPIFDYRFSIDSGLVDRKTALAALSLMANRQSAIENRQ
jgi:hypothetical protein